MPVGQCPCNAHAHAHAHAHAIEFHMNTTMQSFNMDKISFIRGARGGALDSQGFVIISYPVLTSNTLARPHPTCRVWCLNTLWPLISGDLLRCGVRPMWIVCAAAEQNHGRTVEDHPPTEAGYRAGPGWAGSTSEVVSMVQAIRTAHSTTAVIGNWVQYSNGHRSGRVAVIMLSMTLKG